MCCVKILILHSRDIFLDLSAKYISIYYINGQIQKYVPTYEQNHPPFTNKPCALMKDKFVSLLNATGRQGINSVITYLEKVGFFEAPASINRHLSYEGGLVEHSLNVYRMAMMLREQMILMKPDTAEQLTKESITIAALLHDVCKANIYKQAKKWRKDEQNRWEQYDTYEADYSRFPLGHGEKSVIMLLRLGLQLTNDEVLAIRWHMGAWNLPFQSYEDKCNISEASDHPLTAIIQAADGLATHIMEK